MTRFCSIMAVCVLVGNGVAWAAAPHMTEDPAVERKALRVAPGMDLSLFASEPMIANPLQMAFDARGRLWVLCSPTYPHVVPGEPPHDYLAVLEDTDGDGRADKRTVFADGLLVPTGFAFGDGGVYLANQPNLLFLRDDDGDDRADSREVLLSGFGTEDNHHAISVFRWGPDGRLYFRQGVFLHSNIETPHGIVRINETGGIFRLTPRQLKLEVYVRYGTNPWSFAFDRWGQNFLGESPQGNLYYLAPNAQKSLPTDRAPTMAPAPKSCGIAFVSGRHFPADWQGDLVLNAFKSQQVLRYKFSDDSSGFAAKELQPPLVASTEPNFRPVDVSMGPDGAIYICDWYNPIIGHMQYNFRDERRDHSHGRIWRLTLAGRLALDPPKIAGATIAELVDLLRAPEGYTREQARHALYDHNRDDAAAALAAAWHALPDGNAEVEHDRLEILWAYQTIGRPAPDVLRRVLRSADARARAAAVRVIPDWQSQLPDAVDLLAAAAKDEHPRVRLEAIVALSFVPSPKAYDAAVAALERPMDRYLDFALSKALPTLESYRSGKADKPEQDVRRLLFLVAQARDSRHVDALLAAVARGELPAAQRAEALAAAAAVGDVRQHVMILDQLLSPGRVDAEGLRTCLTAITGAARMSHRKPSPDASRVTELFRNPDPRVVVAALDLAAVWRLESAAEPIRTFVEAESTPAPVRSAALTALATIGGAGATAMLDRLSASTAPLPVRVAAVSSWSAIDVAAAAARAARLMAGDAAADPAPLVRAILERGGGADALAKSLAGQKLSADTARLALRAMFAAGRQDAALVAELNRTAGMTTSTKLSRADLGRLLADVASKGDAARGEAVFRRKELSCQKCHAIGGGGGNVGPDLAGLGAGAPMDYIAESILEPSKAIREGFSAVALMTDEGRMLQGIRVRQTAKELVLRDAAGVEVAVPLASIEEQHDAGSLMPTGVANLLSRQELVDLVRFISLLGKPGAYATPNLPLVRSWKVLVLAPELWLRVDERDLGEMIDENRDLVWSSEYSATSGMLPREALGTGKAALVRAQIEVTTPGAIRLNLNSPTGVRLLVDRRAMPVKEPITATLERGLHTLTFFVDLAARGSLGMRCEIAEARGSAARARVVQQW